MVEMMSAYLLVSLHTSLLHQPQLQPSTLLLNPKHSNSCNTQTGSWKQVLNNLRLVIQPSVILNLLQPWLNLFPRLSAGLECLIALALSSLPCHEPYPDSTFLLPRVIEDGWVAAIKYKIVGAL